MKYIVEIEGEQGKPCEFEEDEICCIYSATRHPSMVDCPGLGNPGCPAKPIKKEK